MDNPYKPPAAELRDLPPPPRSPVVGVLAGIAIDIGGGLVSGILIGIVYAAILAADGTGSAQIQTALTEPNPRSAYFVLSTVSGYSFSLLGGYVCARLVRQRERNVTGILAAISGVVGFTMGGATTLGLSAVIFFTLLQVVCVVLGGELGRRRNLADAGNAGAATAA